MYHRATRPSVLATVYRSPGLILVGIPWPWEVAMKVLRYQENDPNDIVAILAGGRNVKDLRWTSRMLEGWLNRACMGSAWYQPHDIVEIRQRIGDAISRAHLLSMVKSWLPQTSTRGQFRISLGEPN